MFAIVRKCRVRRGIVDYIHPWGRGGHPLLTSLALLLAMAVTTAPKVFAQDTPASSATAPVKDQETQKLNLETQKLNLELKKLQGEIHSLTWVREWATAISAIFIPLVLVLAGYILNKRLNDLKEAEERRQSEFEAQEERRRLEFGALIEDRVRAYALAYEELSPTAIFFPRSDVRPGGSHPGPDVLQSVQPGPALLDPTVPPKARSPKSPQLGRDDCKRMGGELSSWYFGAGGLLMTEDARDVYFALMEALRLAAGAADELAVPTVGEHGQIISLAMVGSYREHLATKYPIFCKLEAKQPVKAADLKDWIFGPPATAACDAERFKDFVLIQQLASRFRTALTDDIRSRRPPGTTSPSVSA